MAFDKVIRSALVTANKVTASLQATVSHAAFSSADSYGNPTYASAKNRKALVEFKPKMVKTTSGEEKVSKATVTFIQPVAVDLRDQITLPDGTTSPILAISGLVDPSTDELYMLQIFL
jgi:hypothetical protein